MIINESNQSMKTIQYNATGTDFIQSLFSLLYKSIVKATLIRATTNLFGIYLAEEHLLPRLPQLAAGQVPLQMFLFLKSNLRK